MKASSQHRLSAGGFTLLEILVSTAVLSMIMVILLSVTDITSKTWKRTTEKMQAFEESRAAFDRITTQLSLATLNPYWDYDSLQNPTKYERTSELQFLSLPMSEMGKDAAAFPTHGLFFQAPTGKVSDKTAYDGMPLLLNAYGYFVEYGPDDRPTWLPASVTAKYRFRLKEWRVSSENWTLYSHTSGTAEAYTGTNYVDSTSYGWIDLTDPVANTLAENVIALVIYPKNTVSPTGGGSTVNSLAEADNFVYNSRNTITTTEGQNQRHQLPPEVEVVMVAIDETSAAQKWSNAAAAPSLFQADWFHTPANLDADLTALINTLSSDKINYIILRSTVKLRAARWSQNP
ncbi:MAG: Verru_Chthon cassette protein C [Chthoniobacteraceae bacterium]